jgi:hypothetical protein
MARVAYARVADPLRGFANRRAGTVVDEEDLDLAVCLG